MIRCDQSRVDNAAGATEFQQFFSQRHNVVCQSRGFVDRVEASHQPFALSRDSGGTKAVVTLLGLDTTDRHHRFTSNVDHVATECKRKQGVLRKSEFARAADAYHLVDHLSLQAGHKELISDEFVRSVALVGDVDTCVSRLRELWALDIDRITFALLSGGREQRLAHLVDVVIPAVEAGGAS